jgi:hypothetical protein
VPNCLPIELLDQRNDVFDVLVGKPSPGRLLPGEGRKLTSYLRFLLVFSLDDADVHVVLVKGVLNIEIDIKETTTSGGDHIELIIGQLDRGCDKIASHLFLQDLVDGSEEPQGSNSLRSASTSLMKL